MVQTSGPTLVRRDAKPPVIRSSGRFPRWLNWVRAVLLFTGIGLVGYYGYTVSKQYVYQDYANWAFDQQISGHAVTFLDYLRVKTPLGLVLGAPTEAPLAPTAPAAKSEPQLPPPSHGALLGRVQIPRLGLSAIVREGVDAGTLSKAVGHVPSTALAGQEGNFAIAAHRDTLFRALKDITEGDLVTFQTPGGSFTYRVTSLRIVKPTEVSVLHPDGGLPPRLVKVSADPNAGKLITLITCYPFYYVGSAPKRFIVQGELVSGGTPPPLRQAEARNWSPPRKAAAPKHRHIHQTARNEPRQPRGSSHIRPASVSATTPPPPKKKGFWHRILHSL